MHTITRIRLVAATCIALAVSDRASSQVFSADLLAPGDGLITRDLASGLDWLDWTQTASMSYCDFQNGVGGWLCDGWRIATASEACDIALRLGVAPSSCPGIVDRPVGTAAAAIALFATAGSTFAAARIHGGDPAQFGAFFFQDPTPAGQARTGILSSVGPTCFCCSFGGPALVRPITPPAFARPYGAGCGSPPAQISAPCSPVIGTMVTIQTSTTDPAVGGALTLVSIGSLPGIDLSSIGMPGCNAYIALPEILASLTLGPGPYPMTFAIPNDPAFAGMSLFAQAAMLSIVPVNPLGMLASNGLELHLEIH
ncbi:MAG: hypothetical protein AB7O97_05690 [Planctomycetota bacterium]